MCAKKKKRVTTGSSGPDRHGTKPQYHIYPRYCRQKQNVIKPSGLEHMQLFMYAHGRDRDAVADRRLPSYPPCYPRAVLCVTCLTANCDQSFAVSLGVKHLDAMSDIKLSSRQSPIGRAVQQVLVCTWVRCHESQGTAVYPGGES